jgi:hypothetical protein
MPRHRLYGTGDSFFDLHRGLPSSFTACDIDIQMEYTENKRLIEYESRSPFRTFSIIERKKTKGIAENDLDTRHAFYGLCAHVVSVSRGQNERCKLFCVACEGPWFMRKILPEQIAWEGEWYQIDNLEMMQKAYDFFCVRQFE